MPNQSTQVPDVPNAAAHANAYERNRDLPRLVPLWPSELKTDTRADHLRLLACLRRALRLERQRGLAGHWAYDLTRHALLLRAYREETARYLAAMTGSLLEGETKSNGTGSGNTSSLRAGP